MQLKGKLEASKGVSTKPTAPAVKPTNFPFKVFSFSGLGIGSFETQMAVKAEDNERQQRLAQRLSGEER